MEEWMRVADGFLDRWNFPHCLGALDGKHVNLFGPNGPILHCGRWDFSFKIIYSEAISWLHFIRRTAFLQQQAVVCSEGGGTCFWYPYQPLVFDHHHLSELGQSGEHLFSLLCFAQFALYREWWLVHGLWTRKHTSMKLYQENVRKTRACRRTPCHRQWNNTSWTTQRNTVLTLCIWQEARMNVIPRVNNFYKLTHLLFQSFKSFWSVSSQN